LKIAAGKRVLRGKSKIVYAQHNMGAGVNVSGDDARFQTVLERWLSEAEQERKTAGG